MTSINANKFNWENYNWKQRLQERIWGTTGHQLMTRLNTSPEETLSAVAYLSTHTHAPLEQKLKEKLSHASLEDLQSICRFAFLNNRPKMIDVCQRLLTLDALKKLGGVGDPRVSAEQEAHFVTRPARMVEIISESMLQQAKKYTLMALHVIFYVKDNIIASITYSFRTIYYNSLNWVLRPPSNLFELTTTICGLSNMRSHIETGYQKTVEYGLELANVYYSAFSTKRRAHLFGLGFLTAFAAIHVLQGYITVGKPMKIGGGELFRNVTQEAIDGKIQKIIGRESEKIAVRRAWDVGEKEMPRIGLLVGPPGCGKTEFVNGLAWESVNDPTSFMYGKQVFAINMMQLVEAGDRFLDQLLRQIKAKTKEENIVIFMDEGHTAGTGMGPHNHNQASFLNLLKTKLQESKIRVLIGTTTEEYVEYIQKDKAFVERCGHPIDFSKLPEGDIASILKDKVELDEHRLIDVDQDVYHAIWTVGEKEPKYQDRANPRKAINIYKDVMSDVNRWTPKQLQQELDREVTARQERVDFCREQNSNPLWITSDEGIAAMKDLEERQVRIDGLKSRLVEQSQKFLALSRNRKLVPLYRNKYYEAVHRAAHPASKEPVQADYLFLKNILRPALHAVVQEQVVDFEATYQEKVPLKVNAAVIQNLYPESFKPATLPVVVVNTPKPPKSKGLLDTLTSMISSSQTSKA